MACVLWLCCGAYAAGFAYRGWVPHDEGTIGQLSERVLAGELPHRDFDDPYTGGLTFLHAAAMRVFGVSLRTPRLVLFAFFMAFLSAVYAIGQRVSSSAGALAAMAIAAVSSVPSYFASVPSWYNLFFATFGVLLFLKYVETGRRSWLVLAGVCGGLSVLAKISGAFYVAGGLVFLTYLEQAGSQPAVRGRRSNFWLVVAVSVALFLVVLSRLLWTDDFTAGALQLFAPVAAVGTFVVWREWDTGAGPLPERTRRLLSLIGPFVAGIALPILLFVLFYWRRQATGDLIRAVLVLSQRRLALPSVIGMRPPELLTVGLAIPYLLLLLAGRRRTPLSVSKWAPVLVGLLGAVLAFASQIVVYRSIWAMLRALPLVATAAGLWTLVMSRVSGELTAERRAAVVLLVTMAALLALIQFPFAAPVYFLYAAPMTLLAIVAVVSAQPRTFQRLHMCIAAFVFLFAVLFTNRSYVWSLGFADAPYQADARLDLGRGGLWVPTADKQIYEEMVSLLRSRVTDGTIYAGPDCPEVYFLSGYPNPTRAIFDALSPDRQDDRWMSDLLTRRRIQAAVINLAPKFSPPLDSAMEALLERRFPSARQVGTFLVRFE